jgi:hypothetical protein
LAVRFSGVLGFSSAPISLTSSRECKQLHVLYVALSASSTSLSLARHLLLIGENPFFARKGPKANRQKRQK